MRWLLLLALLCIGCPDNSCARRNGGTILVQIEPGQKVVNVTWKEDDLWILTRPAREGETAETWRFQERSSFGILEGTVILQER